MTRPIKFRAWDTVSKKFLYPWPNGFSILGETTCFDLIGMQLKEMRPDQTTIELLNDVELQQYTGLLDKNGKEIYEGDVVQVYGYGWQDDDEEKEYGLYVKLCRDVVTMGRFPHYWLEKESHGYEGEDLVDPEYCEVIGNIYENPELVGASK